MRIHVIILYLQHLLFEKDKLKKIKRVGILFVLSQERETDILVCYKSHAESVEELRNKSDMSHFTPDQKITFFFFFNVYSWGWWWLLGRRYLLFVENIRSIKLKSCIFD